MQDSTNVHSKSAYIVGSYESFDVIIPSDDPNLLSCTSILSTLIAG